MRASICEASGLAVTTVGEEIGVTNRCSDSGADKEESWSVGVDTFNIVGITRVNSTIRVANGEQGTTVKTFALTRNDSEQTFVRTYAGSRPMIVLILPR